MYFLKPIIAYTAAEAAEEQIPNDLVVPANIFRLIVAAVLVALAVLAFFAMMLGLTWLWLRMGGRA